MDMTPQEIEACDRLALSYSITDRMKDICIDLVTLRMRVRDQAYTEWALRQVEAANA